MTAWYAWSNGALVVALIGYIVACATFSWSVTGRQWHKSQPQERQARIGVFGFRITLVALASHLVYFALRWIANGFIPVSNFFEFIAFLAMMIAIAFVLLFLVYRHVLLGIFVTPLSMILLAYAMVFPWEAQPLVPSLQSVWLYVHVTTAATGEAFFAVAFAAGLMYLLRMRALHPQISKRKRWGIEWMLVAVLIVVGFIMSAFIFRLSGYEATFVPIPRQVVAEEERSQAPSDGDTIVYAMPPLAAPYGYTVAQMDEFLGITQPLTTTPSWMHGVQAGRKWNTVLWSVSSGLLLYGLLRLLVRQPLSLAIGRRLEALDLQQVDEIGYRAIAIGFPIFTLGALIFAMIWAQIAWNRFWGWDPKEVWALITWLFYSAYLHVRLRKGWEGERSAWLAVVGFVVVMFTLVGVNLVIAGLHSYAGV